jgi:2-polyprenyl-3-methyl-5-hydroxy-6-metoxy-1,4-benzoquinol methylase
VIDKNNIEYYSNTIDGDYADFNDCIIDEMQKAELSNHFWFKARIALIMDVFNEFVKSNASILDIGSGTGLIAKSMQSSGYDVSVADIHEKALQKACDLGVKQCYLMDIYEPPFENKFDVITLFDVIEHLDNDDKALHNVFRMIKPGGKLILTVPAHQWLWNNHDTVAGHKRRYSKKTLINTMESAGFNILKCTFMFRLLLPLFIIRKYYGHVHQKNKEMFAISSIVNNALASICKFERRFGNWIPDIAGGSLMVVAIKPIR